MSTGSAQIHSSDSSSAGKLIFAPGAASAHPSATQAGQFKKSQLELSHLDPSPFTQFNTWFTQARASAIPQSEACTLATAQLPSGRVSARIVYLKELDTKGFVVYSNWETSRKSGDMRTNPYGALTFWWRELERQVRVEGTLQRLERSESQVYFDTRIRGSKIGAWASAQSSVLENGREELDERVKEVEKKFEGTEDIPVPEFWGGVRLVPETVEFWQGRESRLHDRFRYERDDGGEWKIVRLSP